MVDTIGHMGQPSLWILGRPYICGAVEFRGVRKSHTLSSICPALRSCLRLSAILFSILTVGSLRRSLHWSSCRTALILVP